MKQPEPSRTIECARPRWLQRMVRRMAHACGLLVVTPETVSQWAQRATEYNRIAGDYDLSDARLSGLNDGRCQSLNQCCHDVMVLNTPNVTSSPATVGGKEQ